MSVASSVQEEATTDEATKVAVKYLQKTNYVLN